MQLRTFVLWLDAGNAVDTALELGLCCFQLSKRRCEVLDFGLELLLDFEKLRWNIKSVSVRPVSSKQSPRALTHLLDVQGHQVHLLAF